MADSTTIGIGPGSLAAVPPLTLDQARALARGRFKSRLLAGEAVSGCDCHDEPRQSAPRTDDEPAASVAAVRFRDSGRTYYFRSDHITLEVGDWVVVETSRGREAGLVVIAPHQVRLNLLQGDLKPVLRQLNDDDVRRMDGYRRQAATAIKTFGAHARTRGLAMKPISAEYAFDGSSLVINYALPDRERAPDGGSVREMIRELASHFGCRVEVRQVGPRDEARLLGGLGRCGRTLCCSSWLPVYPEISMNMAKAQDLPLNPSKVSGVCGRLLCCLSYENEQYKQMKAIMPRLGQEIETPAGLGMVVSLQILKELVTVRLAADNAEAVFAATDLGLGTRPVPTTPLNGPVVGIRDDQAPRDDGADNGHTGEDAALTQAPARRRRRRGRRAGSKSDGGAIASAGA